MLTLPKKILPFVFSILILSVMACIPFKNGPRGNEKNTPASQKKYDIQNIMTNPKLAKVKNQLIPLKPGYYVPCKLTEGRRRSNRLDCVPFKNPPGITVYVLLLVPNGEGIFYFEYDEVRASNLIQWTQKDAEPYILRVEPLLAGKSAFPKSQKYRGIAFDSGIIHLEGISGEATLPDFWALVSEWSGELKNPKTIPQGDGWFRVGPGRRAIQAEPLRGAYGPNRIKGEGIEKLSTYSTNWGAGNE